MTLKSLDALVCPFHISLNGINHLLRNSLLNGSLKNFKIIKFSSSSSSKIGSRSDKIISCTMEIHLVESMKNKCSL